ncbi:DNA repair protein [Stenotrophomonas rhizophila]
MAKGNFRLHYIDDHGQQRPAAQVRYRILEVPEHRQVAVGETDAFGLTQTVETTSSPFSVGTVPVKVQTRVPMMPSTTTRFALEVWDYALQQWSAPDYAKKARSAVPQAMELQLSTAVMTMAPAQMVIEVQPYFKLRFCMQADNKPLANAPYLAYAIDGKGREVAGNDADKKPIKGNTDKSGCTPRIACNGRRRFSFNLPGTKVERSTLMLEPLLKGQKNVIYTLGMKSQVAMTESGSGRVANVDGKISAPAVLNAEAQELLLLTPDVWAEFEELSGLIENTMAGLHRSRTSLDNALQGRDAAAVAAAEKALGIAEDDVAKMLNENFGQLADLQELVTFESYDKGRTAGSGSFLDRSHLRRRYIPAKKYEDMKRRRIKGVPIAVNMSASAKVKGQHSEVKVAGKHDPLGTKDFSATDFVESLRKLTIQAKKETKTDPVVFDIIEAGGNEFVEHVQKSDSYEVASSAQWLRFVAGCGASAQANWDPLKGRASAKAEASASAKLVLFEGKWTHSYSVPSIKGWQMQFNNVDLGAIVFVLACDLYGFAGAKGTLAGSAEIKYEGKKPVATAQPRDRSDSLAENFDTQRGLPRANLDEPRVRVMGLNESAKGNGAGVEITAEVFAGVEGGITPSGDLRWLPPDRKDPVSFAKIAFDVAVSAGAGAKAQLTILFNSGKFRVRASARLCWGVGAKGAVDFAVDAAGMIEFAKWIYYQLAHAGFKLLTYIAQDAFQALSKIMFLVIAEKSTVGQYLAGNVEAIDAVFDVLQAKLERAEARSKLVERINKKPDWLVYATPETRGMLLYAITRHYAETHARNAPSVEMGIGDLQVHALPAHKQAILNIMLPVSTRPEWENVMQHMTIDGFPRADSGKAEGDVVRFLDYGWSLNKDLPAVFKQMNVLSRDKPSDVGNSYLQKYLEKRVTLMKEFPRGYSVAQLMSIEDPMQLAALDGVESPTFAMMDPPGLWLDRDSETMMA